MQPPGNIWLNFFDARICWCRAAVDIKYILRAVREIVTALTELSERAQGARKPKIGRQMRFSMECVRCALWPVLICTLFYA